MVAGIITIKEIPGQTYKAGQEVRVKFGDKTVRGLIQSMMLVNSATVEFIFAISPPAEGDDRILLQGATLYGHFAPGIGVAFATIKPEQLPHTAELLAKHLKEVAEQKQQEDYCWGV